MRRIRVGSFYTWLASLDRDSRNRLNYCNYHFVAWLLLLLTIPNPIFGRRDAHETRMPSLPVGCGVAADAGVAKADIIQSTPSLPPAGAYTSGDFCVQLGPGGCVVNPALSGFTGTTSIFGSSGQSIDSSISLISNVYTDNGGNPGAFLGSLDLFGPIGILYSGRTSDTELGTFDLTLTELDLTGTFNGHSVESCSQHSRVQGRLR